MSFIKIKISLLLVFLSLVVVSCKDGNSVNNPNDISPEACFEMNPTTAKVGDIIEFTNCSQNASSFTWDFGDGNISSQREPSHTYGQHGDYEIQLLAGEDSNNDGILTTGENPNIDMATQAVKIDPNHTSAEFTVNDANSWTEEDPNYSVVDGAILKLFASEESLNSGTPDHTVESDENGIGIFYDLEEGDYRLIIDKGDLSSIFDGYIVAGVFESQEDIDNHAEQENAAVGGLKFADINGDGLINADDKHGADYITISIDETLTKNVYLAN